MLPYINVRGNVRQTQGQFGGYNTRDKIDVSELFDMKNLSSDKFPCITPRKGRKVITGNLTNIQGVIAPRIEPRELSSFTGVADNKFYYNGVSMTGTLTSGEKCLADFNGTIVIFPDRKMFDYVKYYKWKDVGSIGTETRPSDYNAIKDMEVSKTGTVTFTTSGNPEDYDSKVVNTVYSSASNYFVDFKVGDSISISGFTGTNDKYNTAIVDSKYQSVAEDKPCSAVINAISSDNRTITFDVYNKGGKRMNYYSGSNVSNITIKVWVPTMNYVCVHNNRLWGLSDGEHGEFIYASALGRATAFNTFAGLASDSWFTQIGTGGKWTGIASFRGNIVAFKNNYLHQVYGSEPFSFSAAKQLEVGCIDHRSIVELGSNLYFLNDKGVYVFGGGEPQNISNKLEGYYKSGAAGSDGVKYYISANKDDKVNLLVYDPRYNTWHKEDGYNALGFIKYNDKLYSVSGNEFIQHGVTSPSDVVEWEAVSKRFTEEVSRFKGVNALYIRANLKEGASVDVYFSADGREPFTLCRTLNHTGMSTVRVEVRYCQCDYYQIKLVGRGEAVIHDIERVLAVSGLPENSHG